MKCFDLIVKDQVAHVVMKRPEKRNSMIKEFWDELPELISDIDNNAKARVIVISSTGPHFTSGIDISLLKIVLIHLMIIWVLQIFQVLITSKYQRTQVKFILLILDHLHLLVFTLEVKLTKAVKG